MSIQIEENISLAKYTTFKIGGPARFFCIVNSESELLEAIKFAEDNKLKIFIIGGGSNLLVQDNGFDGIVIKVNILGIKYDGNLVWAGAGENWDNFVKETISHNYSGLENLSLIPGTVGASPVQNIGAYGVEVSEYIDNVRAYDLEKKDFVSLNNTQCGFAYRDSLFKRQKGRFVIVSVIYKLKKDSVITNISYKDLVEYFTNKKSIKNPTLLDVREAVIEIRKAKLPDWKEWGTAGSFFKNPIIKTTQYADLKKKYPDLPGFPQGDDIKVPLGWILDKICNAKGMSLGNVHVYEKQALVLVSKSGTKAIEVMELAQKIVDLVKEKTNIDIEREVEVI